jgi:hypothetical protein
MGQPILGLQQSLDLDILESLPRPESDTMALIIEHMFAS